MGSFLVYLGSIDPELAQRCIIDFGFRPQTVFHKPEVQIIEEKKIFDWKAERKSLQTTKGMKNNEIILLNVYLQIVWTWKVKK